MTARDNRTFRQTSHKISYSSRRLVRHNQLEIMARQTYFSPYPLASLAGAVIGFASLATPDCPTSPNGVGAGVEIVETQPQSIAATGAPARVFGTLIYSPMELPPVPFGHGMLCVAPFVAGAGRAGNTQFSASGDGSFELPLSITDVYVQLWYRDTDGVGNTSNSVFVGGAL